MFPTKSGQFNLEGTKRIRCVIADDHTLLRDGVRRLLEDAPDFAVVGEAGDASEALKLVIEHRPDIVLLDISMPGMSSFEAARLMYDRVESEYFTAKRKAAKRLCRGTYKPGDLPSNAEIRDQVQTFARMHEGGADKEHSRKENDGSTTRPCSLHQLTGHSR